MNTFIPKILVLFLLQTVVLLAQNPPSSSNLQENEESKLHPAPIVIKPSQSPDKVEIINPNEAEIKAPSQTPQTTSRYSHDSTTAPLSEPPKASASHHKVEPENDYLDDEDDEDDFDDDSHAENDEDNDNQEEEDFADDDSDDDWNDDDDDGENN